MADKVDLELLALDITNVFRDKLLNLYGECFRTEVRKSKIYICGTHHGLWDRGAQRPNCPAMESLYGESHWKVREILDQKLEGLDQPKNESNSIINSVLKTVKGERLGVEGKEVDLWKT